MPRIYCVEDDENVRELVAYALKSVGFEVMAFEFPLDFYAALNQALPDLVLLDIMLAQEDGISILKKLRSNAKYSSVSIIMLTAKSSEYERVRGLDMGADDYLTKPFSVLELISRIKAVLRRTAISPAGSEILECGNIKVNVKSHIVTANAAEVALTYKEFELLSCLLRNADTVLTRDMLMNLVWGTDFQGESRTVDMHIKTLRQKLGSAGEQIETIRGVGYKMSQYRNENEK